MKQVYKILLAGLTWATIITGCSKEKDVQEEGTQDPPVLAGTYNGNFSRTGMATTDITIAFTGNNFSGSSTAAYPVICNGTFTINTNQVSFTNACNETGAIVLNGTYNYTLLRGATFRIWRTNNNITDEYTITLAR
ncbi:hypothetical protein ACFS6H_14190 [Terrimonas rubra]|uniref:Lipocalin-like domain-containing protein n=1 Tax=Terrimonas rubra TaxID=1035890 RepID=A0ABW6A680_9BACT